MPVANQSHHMEDNKRIESRKTGIAILRLFSESYESTFFRQVF